MSIYESSYEEKSAEEKEKARETLEHLRNRKSESARIRKLGKMLREARSEKQGLTRRLRDLEEENARLKEKIHLLQETQRHR